MKKIIAFIISLALFSIFGANAQESEFDPGIYSVTDDVPVALTYSSGVMGTGSTGIVGIEVGRTKCSYKGTESGVLCTGTLLMVIDPEKKNIVRTLKKYDPFVKSMTPDNIMIVPLMVDKNKRVYDEGISINGFNVEKKNRVPFIWERVSDNAFLITAEVVPGEYAVVFRPAKLGGFDFESVFCFTVPPLPEE